MKLRLPKQKTKEEQHEWWQSRPAWQLWLLAILCTAFASFWGYAMILSVPLLLEMNQMPLATLMQIRFVPLYLLLLGVSYLAVFWWVHMRGIVRLLQRHYYGL